MESKHKVVLVPMDEELKNQKNIIIKRIIYHSLFPDEPIGSIKFVEDNAHVYATNWQPRQLLIVSDEAINIGDMACRKFEPEKEGGIVRANASNCSSIQEHWRKIISAYPQIDSIPTIELSDIQEMERRGWPESVDVETAPLCKKCKYFTDTAHHAQNCEPNTDIENVIQTDDSGSILINWETETNHAKMQSNNPKYPLFKHMADEHGLTLTDDQLREIENVVMKITGVELLKWTMKEIYDGRLRQKGGSWLYKLQVISCDDLLTEFKNR